MIALRFGAAVALVLAGVGSAAAFEVSSSSVSDGKWDKKYWGDKISGCDGQNVSPALSWKDLPDGTKSLAVTLYDPDAPTGSGWWHWQMWNIDPSVTGFEEGKVPKRVALGGGDVHRRGYLGPCPPPGTGTHHYIFTVYAIKEPKLKIPRGATPAFVGYNLNANTIAKATVTYTLEAPAK